MRRGPSSIDTMVGAFRDLTEAPADGAATRARVLVDVGRAQARRARLRRIGVPIAAVVIAMSSVSAAVTGIHRSWWGAAAVRLDLVDAAVRSDAADTTATPWRFAVRSRRVIPALSDLGVATFAAVVATPQEDAREEARAYGRAHRAHFVDDAPARALAAWSAYLAAFPRGTFAPEAAYNRAICLVRLGRRAEATRALRRFADGPPGGYRRDEARRLLDWLGVSAR